MLLDFFVDSCLRYLSKLYIGIIEIILVSTNFVLYYNQGVLPPLFPGLPTRRDNTSSGTTRYDGIFFEINHSHKAVIVLF